MSSVTLNTILMADTSPIRSLSGDLPEAVVDTTSLKRKPAQASNGTTGPRGKRPKALEASLAMKDDLVAHLKDGQAQIKDGQDKLLDVFKTLHEENRIDRAQEFAERARVTARQEHDRETMQRAMVSHQEVAQQTQQKFHQDIIGILQALLNPTAQNNVAQ